MFSRMPIGEMVIINERECGSGEAKPKIRSDGAAIARYTVTYWADPGSL